MRNNNEPHVLRWGDRHLLLRHVRDAISLRQLHVDGDRKSIAVRDCAQLPVHIKGLDPLPSDARLVAAREVESDYLGICLPILVFLAPARAVSAPSPRKQPAKRRRRESDASPGSLFFFALAGADTTYALQLINRVDLPATTQSVAAITNSQPADATSDSALHVHLVNGPYAVVYNAPSAQLTILRLEAADARFAVWRANVPLPDAATADDACSDVMALQSCTRVASDASTEPHLLLHFSSPLSVSASVFNSALESRWLVFRLAESAAVALEPCAYVAAVAERDDSSDEQVMCCALLARGDTTWRDSNDDTLWLPSAAAAATVAEIAPVDRQRPLSVTPSTLVVTGTTRNTLYVHDCGVLLLTCVLPTTPGDIMQVDATDDSFVLAVHCSDVNGSFFLLSFSASAFQPTMTIVHAFSHVGRALVGDFTAQSSTAEVLLLNDMSAATTAVATSSTNDDPATAAASAATASDVALVRKCVVICKKHAADKHSIHRLRADEPTAAAAGRGTKRSRSKHDAAAPQRYIERIKLGAKQPQPSVRHRALVDDSDTTAHSVSQRHLAHLASSLTTRLQRGVDALDRLQLVVADKRDLAVQLRQFVIDAWWRAQPQSREHLPLRVAFASEPRAAPRIAVTQLVAAAAHDPVDASPPKLTLPYELEPLVALQRFRVMSFSPATATLRVLVTLCNASTRSLFDAFVSLADSSSHEAVGGGAPLQWLETTSSVQHELGAESAAGDGVASFVVDATLPPTFALLRMREPVRATVWLHCRTDAHSAVCAGAGSERRGSRTTGARSSATECALAVGVVTIQPHEFARASSAGCLDPRETLVAREIEELLVLSSGSSLTRVFDTAQRTSSLSPHRAVSDLLEHGVLRPKLVRPTFALVTLAIAERAAAKFDVSELLAALPNDVFTMLNPLQTAHVERITALLQAIRAEFVVLQQRSVGGQRSTETQAPASVAVDHSSDDAMSVDSDASAAVQQHWQLLMAFRRRQSETDVLAAALLHALQRRANYHSMWHAPTP